MARGRLWRPPPRPGARPGRARARPPLGAFVRLVFLFVGLCGGVEIAASFFPALPSGAVPVRCLLCIHDQELSPPHGWNLLDLIYDLRRVAAKRVGMSRMRLCSAWHVRQQMHRSNWLVLGLPRAVGGPHEHPLVLIHACTGSRHLNATGAHVVLAASHGHSRCHHAENVVRNDAEVHPP